MAVHQPWAPGTYTPPTTNRDGQSDNQFSSSHRRGLPQISDDGSVGSEEGDKLPGIYDLFGPPTKDVPDYRSRSVEHYDLPDAYTGPSKYMSQVMINQITNAEAWPVSELLPWKRWEESMEIHWDEWHFEDALPDRVPEESVGRLLTSFKKQHMASFIRWGICMLLEHTFMRTLQGQLNYRMNIEQIRNAVIEGASLGALLKCLTNRAPGNVLKSQAGQKLTVTEFESILQEQYDMFGVVQKDTWGLRLALQYLKDKLVRQGGNPGNYLVLPSGMGAWLAETPVNSQFLYSGRPSGPDDGALSKATSGCIVRESRGFRMGDKQPDYDPCYRDTTIGNFTYNTWAHLRSVSPNKYLSCMRNMITYSEDKDGWHNWSLDVLIRGCGLWDFEGDEGDMGSGGGDDDDDDDFDHMSSKRSRTKTKDRWGGGAPPASSMPRQAALKDLGRTVLSNYRNLYDMYVKEGMYDYFVETVLQKNKTKALMERLGKSTLLAAPAAAAAAAPSGAGSSGPVASVLDATIAGIPKLLQDAVDTIVLSGSDVYGDLNAAYASMQQAGSDTSNWVVPQPGKGTHTWAMTANGPTITPPITAADLAKPGHELSARAVALETGKQGDFKSPDALNKFLAAFYLKLVETAGSPAAKDKLRPQSGARWMHEVHPDHMEKAVELAKVVETIFAEFRPYIKDPDWTAIMKSGADALVVRHAAKPIAPALIRASFVLLSLCYIIFRDLCRDHEDSQLPANALAFRAKVAQLASQGIHADVFASQEPTLTTLLGECASSNATGRAIINKYKSQGAVLKLIADTVMAAPDIPSDKGEINKFGANVTSSPTNEDVAGLRYAIKKAMESTMFDDGDIFIWFYDNDLPIALGFVLLWAHKTYTMGSSFLTTKGYGTGATFVGHCDFQFGDDMVRKLMLGNLTYYCSNVVTNRKNIALCPNVFCKKYVGGAGVQCWKYSADDREKYKNGNVEDRSVFICFVPAAWVPTKNTIDITGRYDPSIVQSAGKDSGNMQWPTANAYSKYWGWNHGAQSPNTWLDYINNGNRRINTICAQDMQRLYDVGSGKMDLVIENKGHWGPLSVPGAAKIRRGAARSLPNQSQLGVSLVF